MVSLDDKVIAVLRNQCETSFEFFVKYMFMEFMGYKFKVKPFHRKLFNTFEDIYDGKHIRVIINIPPRHSKTEISKMFLAWVLAKNPKAKSLILSYSSDLATDNASFVRDYVLSQAFQKLWPIELKPDKKGKGHWVTTGNGEVYAAAAGGQVTGFGAGLDNMGCKGGLILIDDPLKPGDAESEKERTNVNSRFVGTVKSRRNDVGVPIVIIMQRIHEEDLSGFLLDGNDGEDWTHIKIPVWDDDEQVIWPERYSQNEAEIANRSQPYVFAGQYLQEPAPLGGGIWKDEWFEIIDHVNVPPSIRWEMFIDGAYTKDTKNDPTGILIAGEATTSDGGKQMYILHNEGVHLEMPELIKRVLELKNKFKIAMILAEPKASGKSLIQLLRAKGINAREIQSRWVQKSKLDKAHDVAPMIEGGRVKLIQSKQSSKWIPSYLKQVGTFPNAKHDEDVDNTAYAVERYLLRSPRRKRLIKMP